MNIFIRADGGNSIGLGHVMRMLVLAKKLSVENNVFFICRNSENDKEKFKAGIDQIKENDFEALEITEENIILQIIRLQHKYKAGMLITDSYDVDEEYFEKLKPYFKLTGYMDDVNKCKMNVDFIINQNFNAELMDYSKSVNKDTQLFLGSNYCLLREEFRKIKLENKVINNEVNDILLTLGGMDNNWNTIKILNVIKNCKKNIHVVLGSAFLEELNYEIFQLSKEFSNIKLYKNAIMSDLMKLCDIAISACGSTLYELCAMGVPTIGVVVAENQKKLARDMCNKNIIIGGLPINYYSLNQVKDLLDKLIIESDFRRNITYNQSGLVNVNGVDLLYSKIISLISKD